MPAKKPATNGVAKKTTKAATPATDLPPADGVVAKTTKARASAVPPKSARAATSLAAQTATDIPSPMTTGVAAEISDEQIREHAYHLWLSGTPGNQDDHWHSAERSLRSRKS